MTELLTFCLHFSDSLENIKKKDFISVSDYYLHSFQNQNYYFQGILSVSLSLKNVLI
jgi:hypothetical protein